MARRKGEETGSRSILCLDPGALAIDLDEMARRPLPGGIAAMAAAAAMGAALIAKSARVALRRRAPDRAGRPELEQVAGQADRGAAELLGVAGDDSTAYRSVIETRALEAGDPARQRAWEAAVEAPLRLAELCLPLEKPIPALFESCPPVVHIDLKIAARLLQAASEAGRLAAAENLENCAGSAASGGLRQRLAALKETKVD